MQRQDINTLLARLLKVDVSRVVDTTQLTDLVSDSFILIETVVELQEEIGISLVQEDLDGVKTVGQLVDVCLSKLA